MSACISVGVYTGPKSINQKGEKDQRANLRKARTRLLGPGLEPLNGPPAATPSAHAKEDEPPGDGQRLAATKEKQAHTRNTAEYSAVLLAFAISPRKAVLLPNERTLKTAVTHFDSALRLPDERSHPDA